MLKILIVEDEIGITALLKKLIQFEKLGLELAGTADTGSQALEIMKETDPDIVITDICMPEMSGLELIEKAKQKNFRAKYVIVSGYSQFEYAVTAIKLGVEDYLLKPISETELNDVLEKLVLSIRSENDAAHSLERMNSRMKLQRKKLRKRLFLDLLFNSRTWGERTLKEINADYSYAFQEGTLFLTGIVRLDGVSGWNLVARKAFLEQLARIFKREAGQCCLEREVCIYNDSLLFLMNVSQERFGEAEDRIGEIWQLFLKLAGSYDELRLTMGCGGPVLSCREIPGALGQAEKVLSCRILQGCGRIYRARDYKDGGRPLIEPELMKFRLRLQGALESQNSESRDGEIRRYLEQVIHASKSSPMTLLDNLGKAVYYLLTDLGRQRGSEEDAAGIFRQIKDKMPHCSSGKELLDMIAAQISAAAAPGAEDGENDARTISRAKDYIWTHYQENIRLEDVAEQVYLTPGYFGVLFKKETGITFSTYLIQVRVEKAKELLRDRKYNISQVAYAVGYQDVRHFSRLFKEYVGLVPKEYRKLHGSGLY